MNNFKIYSEFNQELKDILSRIYNNQNNKIFQNYIIVLIIRVKGN